MTITAVLILSAILTAIYAWNWSSPTKMWTAATRTGSGDLSRAHQEAGIWHRMAKQDFIAESFLREAVNLNPRMGPALSNLAVLYAEQNKLAEAIPLMERAVAVMAALPEAAESYVMLGLMLEQSGREPEAVDAYIAAIERKPEAAMAWTRLGIFSFAQGNMVEAHARFEQAFRTNSGHWEYVWNYAATTARLGDMTSANQLRATIRQPMALTPHMIRMDLAGLPPSAQPPSAHPPSAQPPSAHPPS